MIKTDLSNLRTALSHDSVIVISKCDENKCFDEASELGKLLPMEENNKTGEKSGNLFTKIEYNPSLSESFSHSNTAQPLHTDGSYERNAPDIVFFFCRQTASFGGATIFMPNSNLIKNIPDDLLSFLVTEKIVHAKADDSKEQTILSFEGDRAQWNWNFFRAQTNDKNQNTIMSFKKLLDHLERCHLCEEVILEKGESVFFWDSDQLHGRNAFIGDRCLIKGGIQTTIQRKKIG